MNIIEYLIKTKEKYPDKVAFIEEDRKITFNDLYNLSKGVATFFIKNGIYKKMIFISLSSKIDTIIVFLAVIMSKNIYVPIELNVSSELKEKELRKIGKDILIIDKKSYTEKKDNIYEYNNIVNTKCEEDAINSIIPTIKDEDTMYVIYTSGSTYVPKGVEGVHGNVVSYINELTKELKIDENTVFGEQSPLIYDAPMKEIYGTIVKGATTIFIPKKYFSYPSMLIDYMNDKKINTILWVSSSLSIIERLNAFKNKYPLYLKLVCFGSENLSIKTLNYWRKHIKNARFFNLYGPTECTGMSTFYEVKEDFAMDRIPIGKPFSDTKVWILDKNKKEVRNEELGEIYIGGKGVTKGYFKNKEKTEEVFLDNIDNLYYDKKLYQGRVYKTGDIGYRNSDNNLIFIGRIDNEIKYMGHKVCLEELDREILTLKNIKNAVNIYDDKNNKIILIYDGEIEEKELKNSLIQIIPKYMLPKRIIKVNYFPKKENGKIDRKEALKIYG